MPGRGERLDNECDETCDGPRSRVERAVRRALMFNGPGAVRRKSRKIIDAICSPERERGDAPAGMPVSPRRGTDISVCALGIGQIPGPRGVSAGQSTLPRFP